MEADYTELSHDGSAGTRGTEPVGKTVRPSPTKTDSIKISETFVSRQGEGKLTGTESVFVRTSGCNLRCHFCDTPYASWNPSGDMWSIDSIIDKIVASSTKHVVLTGGEPLLPKSVETLCRELKARSFHITIETAGTIDRDLPCDLMSISPKLASSTPNSVDHPRWSQLHQQRRLPVAIMKKLARSAADFQIKFVVCDPSEFAEIDQVVRDLEVANEDVWLMPEGVTIDEMNEGRQWLQPHCESSGYHFCDRMQIHWYGNRRGT